MHRGRNLPQAAPARNGTAKCVCDGEVQHSRHLEDAEKAEWPCEVPPGREPAVWEEVLEPGQEAYREDRAHDDGARDGKDGFLLLRPGPGGDEDGGAGPHERGGIRRARWPSVTEYSKDMAPTAPEHSRCAAATALDYTRCTGGLVIPVL